ncbi:hydrogenase maturation nickel metallochaperone HypA [Clostridiaceae bacterium 68-1-5]|uniref:Hydrogenase maturation factor HypA n=1 Tax=Suipraeoptans intestinalis TaxID=2606628 RepID=A0A6N7UT43_9FIRM|nr:hydrogenase maturation nickel metallochaperone HypA [Suipraeoptans intestinalis]MSR94523.1 hydrogenase maturation nickel metallochaperone HypA [Suipraeoptans intestinalis]
MHELGIVFEIVKKLDEVVRQSGIDPSEIAEILLELGEASTIVPKYLKECWPAATDGTEFEHVEMEIQVVTATVRCKQCGKVYEYLNQGKVCPGCGSEACSIVTGREFYLKEIHLFYEEEEV